MYPTSELVECFVLVDCSRPPSPACAAPWIMARASRPGGLLELCLVQCIHRALVRILNRAAEAEGIRDDHGESDRGHKRDQKAVLHEVLTPLVPDELLRELEHVISTLPKAVLRTHPSSVRWRHFRRDGGRAHQRPKGDRLAREGKHEREYLTPHGS